MTKQRTERERAFQLRVSDEERRMLEKLASAEDLSSSQLVRRWIRQRYEAAFGG